MLSRYFPLLGWLKQYSLAALGDDCLAGLIVVFITVPQVIAYAFLAGLPPELGLYSAIFALIGYAACGSSRTLAVGPTAIVAMMTLESTSAFATPGTETYVLYATQLALITGLLLIGLRLINFGALTSFLSHAVITGFISAAAIVILVNQVPALLGLQSALDTSLIGVIVHVAGQIGVVNLVVLALGTGAVLLLVFCRTMLKTLLVRMGMRDSIADNLVKAAPMYAVAIGIGLTAALDLDVSARVAVVGDIPAGLPTLGAVFGAGVSSWIALLPSAFLIAMVVFLESTSIGSAMASKRRQKIEPNQELLGLGMANAGASIAGGFPVAGSFARTVVNFGSGAVTQVASLVTALLVLATLVALADAFYYLPRAVLAAIIVVSAWQLIDVAVIRRIFSFNRTDAITFSFTFVAVLATGVETGIAAGILISFLLLIRNSSRPHIAVVGRVGDSEQFRSVLRHEAKTAPHLLAVRVDESLYFVNVKTVETFLTGRVAESKEIKHVLLICTAMNFIDSSGLEMLETLSDNLFDAGVTLHLSEVKGPVMDKLTHTDFYQHMHGRVYFTTDTAFRDLANI